MSRQVIRKGSSALDGGAWLLEDSDVHPLLSPPAKWTISTGVTATDWADMVILRSKSGG
jgi:hypothetical protein